MMTHDDRETFLAWNTFHMTLKRKLNVWLSMVKFLTSFAYFSEEICSFQAMSEKDIYDKSCTSVLPVLLHLCKKLATTDKITIFILFKNFLEGITFTMSRSLGEREISQQNFRRKCKASRQLTGSGFPDF